MGDAEASRDGSVSLLLSGPPRVDFSMLGVLIVSCNVAEIVGFGSIAGMIDEVCVCVCVCDVVALLEAVQCIALKPVFPGMLVELPMDQGLHTQARSLVDMSVESTVL